VSAGSFCSSYIKKTSSWLRKSCQSSDSAMSWVQHDMLHATCEHSAFYVHGVIMSSAALLSGYCRRQRADALQLLCGMVVVS
jgi:hypothetical protein